MRAFIFALFYLLLAPQISQAAMTCGGLFQAKAFRGEVREVSFNRRDLNGSILGDIFSLKVIEDRFASKISLLVNGKEIEDGIFKEHDGTPYVFKLDNLKHLQLLNAEIKSSKLLHRINLEIKFGEDTVILENKAHSWEIEREIHNILQGSPQ